ncbi:transposase [Sedimentisphaera salicampi]|uniref:transposase n=1 Tax=Sedimentisphaera salicampi TaxID=1941349 RepID=UPI001374802D|nr:transposase [Sedimentisphaera salicampi]
MHGRSNGSVDRKHNKFGQPYLPENEFRVNTIRKNMQQRKVTLNPCQRDIALKSIVDICAEREWNLMAAHVRSEHLHIVVSGKQKPERMMTEIKSKATRLLRKSYPEMQNLKIWTRHGSTKYIWKTEHIYDAIKYVLYEQGVPMSVYHNKSLR